MTKIMIEMITLVLSIGTALLKPVAWFLAALHEAEERRAAEEKDRLRAVHNPSAAEEENGSSSRGIFALLALLLLPSFLAGLLEGE